MSENNTASNIVILLVLRDNIPHETWKRNQDLTKVYTGKTR